MSIERVQIAAAQARRAQQAWETASAELTAAMHEARQAGSTLQAIADAAGISRQVVHRRLKP